jgi:peptidoglycan hydrolase CwlO-like protein
MDMLRDWIFFALVPVGVAIITIIGQSITETRRMRKDNDTQYKLVQLTLKNVLSTIRHLDRKLDRVETKIDKHLGEHDGMSRQEMAYGGK